MVRRPETRNSRGEGGTHRHQAEAEGKSKQWKNVASYLNVR